MVYCLIIQEGLLTVSRREVAEYDGRPVDQTASQAFLNSDLTHPYGSFEVEEWVGMCIVQSARDLIPTPLLVRVRQELSRPRPRPRPNVYITPSLELCIPYVIFFDYECNYLLIDPLPGAPIPAERNYISAPE